MTGLQVRGSQGEERGSGEGRVASTQLGAEIIWRLLAFVF
jgi:hypothetical protein